MVQAGFGHMHNWMEQLEQRPGRDRILFCLDEFERLEEVVGEKPETKQQLVQLMGLMRATIQHRRRVDRLPSLSETNPLWPCYSASQSSEKQCEWEPTRNQNDIGPRDGKVMWNGISCPNSRRWPASNL